MRRSARQTLLSVLETVTALVFLRLSGQIAAAENSTVQGCAQQRPERVWPQIVALLSLGALVATFGWHHRPPTESEVKLPGQLVVFAPVLVSSPSGEVHTRSVEWDETHGMPLNGLAPLPSAVSKSPRLPDQPRTADTVRARVAVTLYEAVKGPTQVEVAFAIPDGAMLAGCQPEPDALSCDGDGPYPNAEISGITNHFRFLRGVIPGGTVQFAFTADFTGLHGLAYDTAGAHTKARLPTVEFTGGPSPYFAYPAGSPPPPPVVVGTAVSFPRANRVNWNQRPVSGGEATDFSPNPKPPPVPAPPIATEDVVVWTYEISKNTIGVPPPISGTDQTIIDHDTNESFLSGIAFGVAGSAFIAGLQVLVLALTRRRPTGS